MAADKPDSIDGEVVRIDQVVPSDLPELPRIPSSGGFFRSVFWDVLRYEGTRRVAAKYDEAWQAVLGIVGTLKLFQDEVIELNRAVNRAKHINMILEADDRKLGAELETARQLPRLAKQKADAEEAKLRWEIVRYEQQCKPKDYEDTVFEKTLDNFRRGLREPQRLREEFERYREELIEKRGDDGLTPGDKDDLRRAEELLNDTFNLREV